MRTNESGAPATGDVPSTLPDDWHAAIRHSAVLHREVSAHEAPSRTQTLAVAIRRAEDAEQHARHAERRAATAEQACD